MRPLEDAAAALADVVSGRAVAAVVLCVVCRPLIAVGRHRKASDATLTVSKGTPGT
jgi:hypothetical protein